MSLEASALVQGVRRADDDHLPFEDVLIVDQTGGEAFDGVAVQFGELPFE